MISSDVALALVLLSALVLIDIAIGLLSLVHRQQTTKTLETAIKHPARLHGPVK